MTDPFDPRRADFSGMIDPSSPGEERLGLAVRELIHKAQVDVPEEDPEAAA